MLIYGDFPADRLATLERAIEQAAGVPTRVDSVESAMSYLDEHGAAAMLCDAASSERLAVQTRARARFAKLPVLALSNQVSDLEFVAAFSWGADDLLTPGRSLPLVTRLRSIPKEEPVPPTNARGSALVAEREQVRRTTVARVLRNAGFMVDFAVTPEDASRFAQNPALAVVVASKELAPDPAAYVSRARDQGSNAIFIVCSAPRDLRADRAALSGFARATVTDGFASPENVLFVANELASNRPDNRATVRLAHGTLVRFRGAGREEDDVGFTYNVSGGGIYVRTLAPPIDDEVWVELCPPRLDRRVRLVGRVAWRRSFSFSETATVPPGFGMQIMDGAARDRALWGDGCVGLLAAVG
jgi:DNA-binding response OmpR family regulator